MLEARGEVLPAVARGAAIVGLQHRVAARSEELHFRMPVPRVALDPRAAVDHHDHRQVLAAGAARHREVGRDLEAVTSLVAHRGHRGHLLRVDPGPAVGEPLELAALAIEEIERAGRHVRARGDDEALPVARGRDGVHHAGKRTVHRCLHRREALVEPRGSAHVGFITDAEDALGADRQAGQVDLWVRGDHLSESPGLGVVTHDGRLVTTLV